MSKFLSGIAAALFVLATNPGPAAAQPAIGDFGAEKVVTANGEDVSAAGATVIVNGQAASVRAAGASVAIHADVAGNADAAGAEVTVDGDVGGARLAGGSVTLTGNVAGDALIGGGVVTVTSSVGGSLKVGGGQVSIGPQAVIAGPTRIGGGTITFDGRAEGGARLTGGSVRVNGSVTGDLVVEGGRIIIGPTAVVSGNVVVRSLNEPTVDPSANIAGTVRLEAPSTWWDRAMFESWPFRFGLAAFLAASALITGIVLMVLGRGTFEDATTLARLKVVSSFLIGLVSLILLPIVAIALMATVAGIPAGLALLFAIPILVVVSYAVAATGLADLIFNRPRAPRVAVRTVIFLIVGSILLGLISLIPVAGPIIILVLLIVGAGAFLRSARRRARRWRRAPPVELGKSPVAA
jgi:hypothetical protein